MELPGVLWLKRVILCCSAENSRCPDDWIRFGNSCYLNPHLERIWGESKSFCEDESAQLVIISSEKEQVIERISLDSIFIDWILLLFLAF